ncbi:hypothetical protein [Streptomyces sp. NPDC088775]|uniref:hypothetical protein n=1 Tax=Streptomyces sp. NPDC088775 TaxID=3365896 RepID=UPI003801B6AB
MRAAQLAILTISGILIAVGVFLMLAGASSSSSPMPKPLRAPAASIGPDGAEPAWTHVCLGSMTDPTWCESI